MSAKTQLIFSIFFLGVLGFLVFAGYEYYSIKMRLENVLMEHDNLIAQHYRDSLDIADAILIRNEIKHDTIIQKEYVKIYKDKIRTISDINTIRNLDIDSSCNLLRSNITGHWNIYDSSTY